MRRRPTDATSQKTRKIAAAVTKDRPNACAFWRRPSRNDSWMSKSRSVIGGVSSRAGARRAGQSSFVRLVAGAFAVAAPPRHAAHVVAALFPEARHVFRDERQPLEPLRRLPSVKLRHDQAHRPAMLRRDRLAVVRPREQ